MTTNETVGDGENERDDVVSHGTWQRALGSVAAVLVLTVAAGACSGDDDDADPSASTESTTADDDATSTTTDDTDADDTDDTDTDESDDTESTDDSDGDDEPDEDDGAAQSESDGDDSNGADGDDGDASEATPALSTIVPPTSPAATAPPDEPLVGVSTLPPVTIGEAAEVQSGLAITVVSAERIEIDEPRPGEFGGTVVAVEIEVENVGQETVDLIGFAVTASDADEIPLIMNLSDPNAPLEGVLAAGATATGTYLFNVDGEGAVVVRIEDALSPEAVIVEL